METKKFPGAWQFNFTMAKKIRSYRCIGNHCTILVHIVLMYDQTEMITVIYVCQTNIYNLGYLNKASFNN